MRRMVKEDLLTFDGKPLFPERDRRDRPLRADRARAGPLRAGHDVRPRGNEPRRRSSTASAATRSASPSPSCSAAWRRARRRSTGRSCGAPTRLERRKQDGPRRHGEQDRRDRRSTSTSSTTTSSPPRSSRTSRRSSSTRRPRRGRSRSSRPSCSNCGTSTQPAKRSATADTDRKWSELRTILEDNTLDARRGRRPRKLIVFTEHRDTLEYLVGRIRTLLGRPEAVAGDPRRRASRASAGGSPRSSPTTPTARSCSRRTPPGRASTSRPRT